jgi:hypothetical protein
VIPAPLASPFSLYDGQVDQPTPVLSPLIVFFPDILLQEGAFHIPGPGVNVTD